MKLLAAAALVTHLAIAQVDPNIVQISGADAIPIGQQIVGPDPVIAAAAAAASAQAAASLAQAEAAKIFLPSASACPGEVKCRKGPPIVIDKPRHQKTITEIVWTATTVNTTMPVTVTSYEIKVEATVAAREGPCIIDNPVDRPGPEVVYITKTNTSTAWWLSYSTTTEKSTTTIGTTSAENCIGTITSDLGPSTPVVSPPQKSPELPDDDDDDDDHRFTVQAS